MMKIPVPLCLVLQCVLAQLSAECPTGCTCSRFFHILQCNNASLLFIPQAKSGLSIYSLDLSHNNILQLKDGAFQEKNIVELHLLSLSYNKITNVGTDAFRGLGDTLISLNLYHNPYIRLPEDGFQLPTLSFLYMGACNLRRISKNFFKGMPDLMTLSLRENHLTNFDANIVKPRTGLELEYLLLTANNFTTLPLELVLIPDTVVEFSGNPFHCDCAFRLAYSLLARKGDIHVTCASPPRLHGVSGSELLAMRLHCATPDSELLADDDTWWVVPGAAGAGVLPLAVYLLYMRGYCRGSSNKEGGTWIEFCTRNMPCRAAGTVDTSPAELLGTSVEGGNAHPDE